MEIPKRLIDCLNENKVAYEILHHPEAVTAQRIAQAEHVKGRHHAKVVMVKSGDQHLMMVLPADHQIDLEKVENAIGNAVSLDKEQEFKSLFPDCAIGAMPPFGNLYGLPTYVDNSLAEQDYIVFEAGTHTDAIKMSYRDYEKIVKPEGERPGDQSAADERSLNLTHRRAAHRERQTKVEGGLRDAQPAIRRATTGLRLAELVRPSASLRWFFGLLARPQLSQRRKFRLSISTERLGRRRRVTFRAASTKPERRMPSV